MSASRGELAFLFVDLNHFKEINDSFGHASGDQLLRQIGPRIRACLRESDLLLRIGGDELAIILLDCSLADAVSVAERVSRAIRDPFVLETVTVRIGASVGIALADTHAEDPDSLMHCADQAMYRAKGSSEWYAVYDPAVDTQVDRLRLVDDLRVALRNGELELHYQPQIDLASRSVVAAEALLRWPHPRLGFVPPLQFLPLAEDAGLMRPLTTFVLGEALAQCADWRSKGHNLTMSINVSATNVLDVDFVRLVEEQLRQHHVPAEALSLEITETTLISDLDHCGRVIDQLRALGCTVSIDDFGAGFTSLRHLQALDVDVVNLDGSFVRNLAKSPDNQMFIRHLLGIARSFGLATVAECVETEEEAAILRREGVGYLQGYYFGKPTTVRPWLEQPLDAARQAADRPRRTRASRRS
jgi:diguanylate cyclase (GGDEF)-like protein